MACIVRSVNNDGNVTQSGDNNLLPAGGRHYKSRITALPQYLLARGGWLSVTLTAALRAPFALWPSRENTTTTVLACRAAATYHTRTPLPCWLLTMRAILHTTAEPQHL